MKENFDIIWKLKPDLQYPDQAMQMIEGAWFAGYVKGKLDSSELKVRDILQLICELQLTENTNQEDQKIQNRLNLFEKLRNENLLPNKSQV